MGGVYVSGRPFVVDGFGQMPGVGHTVGFVWLLSTIEGGGLLLEVSAGVVVVSPCGGAAYALRGRSLRMRVGWV